jgi:rubredoxin
VIDGRQPPPMSIRRFVNFALRHVFFNFPSGYRVIAICSMPQPHHPNQTRPLNDQRRCPLCGVPMFLSRIEPADKVDHDQRTFECSTCDYSETVTVKFR